MASTEGSSTDAWDSHPHRVWKFVTEKGSEIVEVNKGEDTSTMMPLELEVKAERSEFNGTYVHGSMYRGPMAQEFRRLFAAGDASKLYIRGDAHYECEHSPFIIARQAGRWVMGQVIRPDKTAWGMITSMGSSGQAQLEESYSNKGEGNITLGWTDVEVSVKASFTTKFRKECVSIGPFGDTGVGKSSLGQYFSHGAAGNPQKKGNVVVKKTSTRRSKKRKPRKAKKIQRIFCHTSDGKASVTSRNTMIDMPFLGDANRTIGFFDTTGMNDSDRTRDCLNLKDMYKSLADARITHGGLNVVAMQYESTQKRFNRSHQDVFAVMSEMFGKQDFFDHMALFINCMGGEFTRATIRDSHAKKFLPEAEVLDCGFMEFAAEQMPDLDDEIYDEDEPLSVRDPRLDPVYRQVLQMWMDKVQNAWEKDLDEKFNMKKYRKEPVPVFFFMPVKTWGKEDNKFIESINTEQAERLYAYAEEVGKFELVNLKLKQREDDLLKLNLKGKELEIAKKNALYNTLKTAQKAVSDRADHAEMMAARAKKDANEAKKNAEAALKRAQAAKKRQEEALKREEEGKKREVEAKRQAALREEEAKKREVEAERQAKLRLEKLVKKNEEIKKRHAAERKKQADEKIARQKREAEERRRRQAEERRQAAKRRQEKEEQDLKHKHQMERQTEELKKQKAKGEEEGRKCKEKLERERKAREEAQRVAAAAEQRRIRELAAQKAAQKAKEEREEAARKKKQEEDEKKRQQERRNEESAKAKTIRDEESAKAKTIRDEENRKAKVKRDEESAKAKKKAEEARRKKEEARRKKEQAQKTFDRERIRKIACRHKVDGGYSFIKYVEFTSNKHGTVKRGDKGAKTNWVYTSGAQKGKPFDGSWAIPSGQYVTEIYGGKVENDTGSFLYVHSNGSWFRWMTGAAKKLDWSENMWRSQKHWDHKAPSGQHITKLNVWNKPNAEKVIISCEYGKLP